MKIFCILPLISTFTLVANSAPLLKTDAAVYDRTRNQVTVPVELPGPAARIQIFVKEGASWKASTEPLNELSASSKLQFIPQKLYFLMGPIAQTLPSPAGQVKNHTLASNLLLMARSPSSAAPSHTEIVSGILFIRSTEEPVPWVSAAKAYQTTLEVGFDSTNSASALRGFFPLAVQLSGSNIDVNPGTVTITEAKVTGYKTATISAPSYAAQAAVIAHYMGADLASDQICPLQIQKLGVSGMVNTIFPMPILFATVVGGCMGGILRLFKLRRKKRNQWYWLVAEGMLVGVVFVAALSAGLGASGEIPAKIADSEIGAFAIAALSGFMGTSALDYFTANLLKKEAPESENQAG